MTLNLDKRDWKRKTLGAVARASKERVDPQDGTVSRYVAGDHMDTDDLKIHRWGEIGDGYLGPAFHRRFHPGQVLYGSRRTYLRKVAVAEFSGVTANTTFVVETRDPSVLLQEFLPFVMTSELFHAFSIRESKGSVNPYVNWSDIERFEFDLPPIDEQKRIAPRLWDIERHRSSLLRQRVAARELRATWLAAEVVRLAELRSVPFESIWTRSPEGGWSARSVGEDTGTFVLSLAALGPDGYEHGHLKAVKLCAEVQSTQLARGDLLVSRANTVDFVGRAAIFPEDRTDVSFPDTMMRLHIVDSVQPAFVQAVLSSSYGRAHMRKTAAGSATSMVKINRRSLGSLQFPDAPVATQLALLEGLARFDAGAAALLGENSALDALGRRIAEEIFGGNK